MFAAGMCTQFKEDVLNGIHQPSDTYKIALGVQADASDCNADLTHYSGGTQNMNGELAEGNGYTAGGKELTSFTTGKSGDSAYIDFDDISWPSSSFTADMAVIYNASKSNRALGVVAFGTTLATNGTFTLQFPAPGSSAVLVIR